MKKEMIFIKAVVCTQYGQPEVLQIDDIEKPVPNDHQICIKVQATAVTASDCIVRGFKVPFKFWIPMCLAIGFRRPRNPILGMVFAGEVESVGLEANIYRKGDRVFGFDRFGFGSYAEYKCVSEQSLVTKMTDNISYEEAAAIPFGGLIALHYLRAGNIHQGQKVLIYGASGAVGTAAIQLAKYFGAAVTGVCSTANLKLVKALGADNVIDYTKENIAEMNNHYDLIFNAVGKKKVKLNCKNVLTQNGKHITVDDGSPVLRIEDLLFLNLLMEMGRMKAVIDRSYPIEHIVEAHRYVDKGHKKGNVIITVDHNN